MQEVNNNGAHSLDECFNQNDIKEQLSLKVQALSTEEQQVQTDLDKMEELRTTLQHKIKQKQLEQICMFKHYHQFPLLKERYQLLEIIGKGGFGEVYKAYDLDRLCLVACKITELNRTWGMDAIKNFKRHLFRENSTHITLTHPNIVKLYDFFQLEEESCWCTVLEYCDGPDLATYLQKHRTLIEKEARQIVTQILLGVRYLHAHKSKIIHYDLKPHNILYHQGDIKICDFGLSKIMEENQTQMELTSQGNGSYWYLPPECFDLSKKPEISQKVDIWSIGVILYQMVIGKKPFGEDMMQNHHLKSHIVMRSLTIEFPFKPLVTGEFKECIKKCLAYTVKDRWDVDQLLSSKFITNHKK